MAAKKHTKKHIDITETIKGDFKINISGMSIELAAYLMRVYSNTIFQQMYDKEVMNN